MRGCCSRATNCASALKRRMRFFSFVSSLRPVRRPLLPSRYADSYGRDRGIGMSRTRGPAAGPLSGKGT